MNQERENEIRFWLRRMAERRNQSEQPTYFCVSADTDPTQAEQDYIVKFGEKPDEIFSEKRNLWLGPVEAR